MKLEQRKNGETIAAGTCIVKFYGKKLLLKSHHNNWIHISITYFLKRDSNSKILRGYLCRAELFCQPFQVQFDNFCQRFFHHGEGSDWWEFVVEFVVDTFSQDKNVNWHVVYLEHFSICSILSLVSLYTWLRNFSTYQTYHFIRQFKETIFFWWHISEFWNSQNIQLSSAEK